MNEYNDRFLCTDEMPEETTQPIPDIESPSDNITF